ncbi:uncharacterized protein CCOS01_00945 [Colletotrichum costaricense]|uniref:Uncharacterized protein n=1 Tax=Colletotrichum costaricense TaxID=1209916 RepID=A0AAI9ZA15_9PEZI|nr:uncharacterized protein CCOS01_00945 [Colletotrichum costaricense]KAI3550963.1 hypothetical protein CSPX01_01458 [Colletotrichum filicis]KAK1539631.1 hypothetical protein CCOS01_00945 [Colletotrichum costaricense]
MTDEPPRHHPGQLGSRECVPRNTEHGTPRQDYVPTAAADRGSLVAFALDSGAARLTRSLHLICLALTSGASSVRKKTDREETGDRKQTRPGNNSSDKHHSIHLRGCFCHMRSALLLTLSAHVSLFVDLNEPLLDFSCRRNLSRVIISDKSLDPIRLSAVDWAA